MRMIKEIISVTFLLSSMAMGAKVNCNNKGLMLESHYTVANPSDGVQAFTWVTSLRQTGDGGYLLAGTINQDRNDSDVRGNDAWLMKVDPRGKRQWTKIFWQARKSEDPLYARNEAFIDLLPLSTTRYIAIGDMWWRDEKNNFIPGVLLSAVKPTGQLIWKYYYRFNYGQDYWGRPDLIFHTIAKTSDGNFVAVGNGAVRFWDEEHKAYYLRGMGILAKLSPQGKILWARAYNSSVPYDKLKDEGAEWKLSSAVEREGYLYVLGTTFRHDDGYGILLLKVEENGDLLWSRRYHFTPDDKYHTRSVMANGLVKTRTGVMASVAYEEEDAGGGALRWLHLINFDTEGTVLEAKRYFTTHHAIWSDPNDLSPAGKGRYLWRAEYAGIGTLRVDVHGRALTNFGGSLASIPTRDGGALLINKAWIPGPELVLDKTNRKGTTANQSYWNDPLPLPSFEEASDRIERKEAYSAEVVDVPIVRKRGIHTGKGHRIKTWKTGLLSKEGTHPPRKHRYTLTDTEIDEDIDGHWLHRYTLDYRGKVTGIIVAPYFVDEKGRNIPFNCAAGAPTFTFATRVTTSGYDGDNTFPKYVGCNLMDGRENTIYVGTIRETDPKAIHPIRMNGKKKRIWFPDMRGSAKGYFISILNGRKDATVLRYDFDTNTTTLLKLPCGSEK